MAKMPQLSKEPQSSSRLTRRRRLNPPRRRKQEKWSTTEMSETAPKCLSAVNFQNSRSNLLFLEFRSFEKHDDWKSESVFRGFRRSSRRRRQSRSQHAAVTWLRIRPFHQRRIRRGGRRAAAPRTWRKKGKKGGNEKWRGRFQIDPKKAQRRDGKMFVGGVLPATSDDEIKGTVNWSSLLILEG